MKRIGIQGIKGAFHEVAARKFFNEDEIEIIPNNTFPELFKSLNSHKSDIAIMAIENTVAGSILPNYELLRKSKYQIKGEVYLTIRQNLVALPGTKIEDITEVHSHPMALLQCQAFFEQHPHITLIESLDTAISARDISIKQILKRGAIASKLAAKIYNLEIIAKSIETNKRNYTRFLIISDKNGVNINQAIERSSICFTAKHSVGSLSQVLSVFAFYQINLTKIQSLPILGKEWEYLFYIDLEFNDYDRYRQSLDAVKPLTTYLSILGEYPKGDKQFE